MYLTSRGIKNAITGKPLFRRKPTFLNKLDLSEAITWKPFKSLSLRFYRLCLFFEKVLRTFIEIHLPSCRKFNFFSPLVWSKIETTVLVMNNLNRPLLSLAKNEWMKLDESLASTLNYFYLCSGCMASYMLAYAHGRTTIWGARSGRFTIVYAIMLLGARKNVYQDF